MATATKELETVDVEIDCPAPGCEGRGFIEHENVRIDPQYIEHHQKYHAYTKDPETREIIGANCDCPRLVGKPTRGECRACDGEGKQHRILTIPKNNQKVNVIDKDLMDEIFGSNQPEGPGRVFDTQGPDEHQLELRSGIGVRVTWDPLTLQGRIRKNTQVELWTFDLLELEIVK